MKPGDDEEYSILRNVAMTIHNIRIHNLRK